MPSLSITAYNMRTLRCAAPYINMLMETSDIVVLAEHRLYNNELYKLKDINDSYEYHAKASADLCDSQGIRKPGHCGIAICWKKNICHKVCIINNESDRICIIELINCLNSKSIYIFGVYLPQRGCKMTSFVTHLDILDKYINQLKEKGHIIVIGDTNCHFGKEYGIRCAGETTTNAKIMYDMACNHQLSIVDTTGICTGPKYSFHVDGVGTSYVDHCATSNGLLPYISKCYIHNEHFANMSDHLPITIEFHDIDINDVENEMSARIPWAKYSEEEILAKYTIPLEEMLNSDFSTTLSHTDNNNIITEHDIEHCIDKLTYAMSICSKNLIKKKSKGGRKHYWNKDLSEMSNEVKHRWIRWKEIGRPRGDDPTFQQYKDAKKEFRRRRKKAEIEYEQKKVQDLCKSEEMDIKFFWHIVNQSKKNKGNRIVPFRISEDEVITQPEKIRKCWKEYFEHLYTPKAKYDEDYKSRIDIEVQKMVTMSYKEMPQDKFERFTLVDIMQQIDSLKMKKAPGYDGIQPEHIKYGGTNCNKILTLLFNSIAISEHIPSQFKIGVIIPLPKGDKDRLIPDNNRGITLLGSIAKLYDKVILKRIMKWLVEEKKIHDLQGSCQEKCSNLQTSWLVRESIAHFNERGTTVYVALLDVAKAFDSIWHNGLFYLLYKGGMDRKLWRLFIISYASFKCCVSIGGKCSDTFLALQGLHQGAPFSMTGYAFFSDVLIRGLVQCIVGLQIADVDITCPAYADDMVVMATNVAALQVLLNKVSEYSTKWRLTFNAQKCAIVVFGQDKNPDYDIYLCGSTIERQISNMHLGLMLTPNKSSENDFIKQRITSCKKVSGAIRAIGSRKAPVTPKSAATVFKATCKTKLLYGTELLQLSATAINEMEKYQSHVAKAIQGLPESCANIGANKTMGWISIKGQIDILKLIFLWRLILLPMSSIYKKILVYRFVYLIYSDVENKTGPLWDMLKTAKSYGLMNNVRQVIENASVVNMETWKRTVKSVVQYYEERQFQIKCTLYPSLHIINEINLSQINISAWWLFVQDNPYEHSKCKEVIRLLLGVHNTNEKNVHKRNFSNLCHNCDMFERETTHHVLFKCKALSAIRLQMWTQVLNNCPKGELENELCRMSDEKRTAFITSGLCDTYIQEWSLVYKAIADFINVLFKEKAKLAV